MSVFVDTSALLAVLDADDANHERAGVTWGELLDSAEPLLTSNYVLVETLALLQRRLGMRAVRTLVEDVRPILGIHWISEAEHGTATAVLLTANRRQLSLVDCTSFLVMRGRSLDRVFAYDRDFRREGFTCIG